MGNPETYTSEDSFTLNIPTKRGYFFTGWSGTDIDDKQMSVTVDTGSTGDRSYTANWEVNTGISYTVTFETNGGNSVSSQILGVGSKAVKPVKEDYVFVNWYTDCSLTNVYDFNEEVTEDITLYAGWEQLKYTMHYGDGRANDGIWGYNYKEGENGYYVPEIQKELPTEIRYFSQSEVDRNIVEDRYKGVTKEGFYFISWMRYVEIPKSSVNPNFNVYVKSGSDFVKETNWESSSETLYQFMPEAKTPDTNCGDIDYYAQWMFFEIDIDIQIETETDITIDGIGSEKALVYIDDSQKTALAKNIDLTTDVRGNNCEINVTVYVKNAGNAGEIESLNNFVNDNYKGKIQLLNYDVSIDKVIKVDGVITSDSPIHLKELAEPIEIQFAIPNEWQTGGTVYLLRTHTDLYGNVTTSELESESEGVNIITADSDEFSTYTILYIPKQTDPTPENPSKPSSGGSNYQLSFDTNGGNEIPGEYYYYGTIVDLNDFVPSKEGSTFIGWFADPELTIPITDVKMTHRKTVYAKWETTAVPDMLNGTDHFAYAVGYEDGTVRPTKNITRAETAAIFFRLLEPSIRDNNLAYTSVFTDVSADKWYNTEVCTMAKLGIIKGRTSTEFVPEANITRAEFAAICARFDNSDTSGREIFTDLDGHWSKAEVERAAALGWVMGYADDTFLPDKPITRAEAMAMINRVLQRLPEDESDLLSNMNRWPDNTNDKWYYLPVQEATNSHDYITKANSYEKWISLSIDPDWSRY